MYNITRGRGVPIGARAYLSGLRMQAAKGRLHHPLTIASQNVVEG